LDLWMSGVSHSRPEPLYFWGYFVGMNAPWIIVPACE
jgi:cholestenol delta-isomerase